MMHTNMIGRTLIVAGILFIAYNALIQRARPWHLPAQNGFHFNQSRAQEYVASTSRTPVVIVGSSLSATLTDALPDTWSSLAFNAQGSFDGLEIIRRSGATPELILVEVNNVTRGMDSRFVNALFKPVVVALRRHFPALRSRYEPASLFLGCINVIRSYSRWHAKAREKDPPAAPLPSRNTPETAPAVATPVSSPASPPPTERTESPPNPAREQAFRHALEGFQTPPDKAEVEMRVAQLKERIDALRAAGVQVLLFELPTHERVFRSPRQNLIRSALTAKLPPEKYPYIPSPDCRQFDTTDGSHLDAPSARRYVHWLVGEVASLRSAGAR